MGKYQRKTEDEYNIMGDNGYGVDCLCTEDNIKDARQRLKEYRENQPDDRHWIEKKRVPIGVKNAKK